MSRLAKRPIAIPSGVEVTINGLDVKVKGSKGELSRSFRSEVALEKNDEGVQVSLSPDLKKVSTFARSYLGTVASHISNMILGVTEGFQKDLELQGIGYRWALAGNKVDIKVGFSHPVELEIPQGLEVVIEKNNLTVKGIDKELVGQFAAKIRSTKKPEPYKGKGIRYKGEYVIRKQGKRA